MNKMMVLISFYIGIFSVYAECIDSSYSSGEEKVSVIELYTSEGCSSCPPADRWLNSLIEHERLWKDFVPLKFHVDYWNYLGWRDELSSSLFSRRQQLYSRSWGRNKVYTPEFILNSKEWGGSINRSVPAKSSKLVGELSVVNEGQGIFKINNSVVEGDLYSFLLVNGVRNKILKGENLGETLMHNFSVIDMKKEYIKLGVSEVKLDISKRKMKDRSVAFVLSLANEMIIVQATGGCLKNE